MCKCRWRAFQVCYWLFLNILYVCFFFKVNSEGFLHNTVATLVTIGSRRSARSRIFWKEFLPTRTTQNQTPSNYAGLIVVEVFKISSKYVGITCSLAAKRTLGISKLLKCINRAQPEPCYKKTSSGAGAMLMKTETSGLWAMSLLQDLCSPVCNTHGYQRGICDGLEMKLT